MGLLNPSQARREPVGALGIATRTGPVTAPRASNLNLPDLAGRDARRIGQHVPRRLCSTHTPGRAEIGRATMRPSARPQNVRIHAKRQVPRRPRHGAADHRRARGWSPTTRFLPSPGAGASTTLPSIQVGGEKARPAAV